MKGSLIVLGLFLENTVHVKRGVGDIPLVHYRAELIITGPGGGENCGPEPPPHTAHAKYVLFCLHNITAKHGWAQKGTKKQEATAKYVLFCLHNITGKHGWAQ